MYSPAKYQATHPSSGGFAVFPEFDKYSFRPINWYGGWKSERDVVCRASFEIPPKAVSLTSIIPMDSCGG